MSKGPSGAADVFQSSWELRGLTSAWDSLNDAQFTSIYYRLWKEPQDASGVANIAYIGLVHVQYIFQPRYFFVASKDRYLLWETCESADLIWMILILKRHQVTMLNMSQNTIKHQGKHRRAAESHGARNSAGCQAAAGGTKKWCTQ